MSSPLPEGGDPTLSRCADLAERLEIVGLVLFRPQTRVRRSSPAPYNVLAERFLLASPPWETFRWAYDKRLSNELATRAGVPHPRTWSVRSAEEAARLDVSFPLIIKPAVKESFNRSRSPRPGGSTPARSCSAASPRQRAPPCRVR